MSNEAIVGRLSALKLEAGEAAPAPAPEAAVPEGEEAPAE